MSNVLEKFLRYVKYDTASIEDVENYPSTSNQIIFLRDLVEELKKFGMVDAAIDEYGYVFATLASNIKKPVPTIGFIAHVDTSPEMPGNNVNPRIIENYDGKDIVLSKELNIILSPSENPQLKDYIGETIITTDGTTLLGADDKAGVAEIIAAMEYLINHPEIKHGTIKIGFTPDEEVGRGVDFFNVKKFNADFAYTLDGGELGELEYENFTASKASIIIKGKNTHPGQAYGKMINSILIATELSDMMPKDDVPANSKEYDGFYHLNSFEGRVDETKMSYILRDFNDENIDKKKKYIQNVVNELNTKYGEGTVILNLKDQYKNMIEKLKDSMFIVDIARKAMEECCVKPLVKPIRGGTDGAMLSFKGLPAPNIFTGGMNFHGRYEYIPVSSMEKAVEVIVKIISLNAGE